MATTYRKSRFSSALDLGVSALAAGSAGFATFAMPEDLFASLIVKSRLPNVLAAAEPPLGETARLAAVAAVALVVFAFVWSLMRALDRVPAPAEPEFAPEEAPEPAVPRVRKADAHPDAPTRRPLLAGRDLGEPLDLEPEQAVAEPEPEPELEPEAKPEPDPLPSFLVAQEPAAEPTPAVSHPEPAAEEAPEPEQGDDLSNLMERFETGLVRKQQAIVRPQPEPDPQPSQAASEQPSDQVGHRLRSAIAGLQKASNRAG